MKHGNSKYKFNQLVEVGDKITERPNNIYSLKAAFRAYNNKKNPKLKVLFDEYGGKKVEIELIGFAEKVVECND